MTNTVMTELKQRSFIEIMKKLLWIVPFRKLTYIKYFIKSSLVWINWVIHILFLAQITGFLEQKDVAGFNEILIIYAAYIFFFEASFFCMRKWWWMETIPMWQQDILNHYLPQYITLDNNKVESVWTWKLMNFFDKGKLEWTEIVAEIFETGTMLLVSILFTIYMIWKVEITYSVLFVILLILFIWIWNYSNNKLAIFRKQRYIWRSDVMKHLVMVLMSKIEILSAGRIQQELSKLNDVSEKLSDINKRMWFHRFFLRRVSQFVISVILLLSFWFLWKEYLEWNLRLSVLVWLTGTLIIMQKSIGDVISLYVKMTKRFISVERLWSFFEDTPQIQWYEEWKQFNYKVWEIFIKNMTFGYDQHNKVFDNFSMRIPWWTVSAFVWNSGSWKSTLVKIISGYLRHDSGDVIIDGQKNKEVSLKSLYKHIGYLSQEPSVFDGTIRENLMYGMVQNENNVETADLQSLLEEAITLSKCEFIYDFPNWLETEIWEKWIRLSWWQRQRIAIAKIFLKNPEIIILDEPTSALDSFSEEQITKAMHNLFAWRTVIIIAHRLQTVKNADNIFVLENGKVVEEWNHEKLVSKEWIYKKMLDLQSGF